MTSGFPDLLFPDAQSRREQEARAPLTPDTLSDLGIDAILDAAFSERGGRASAERLLASPCVDPEVIRYRQGILGRLLESDDLTARLDALQPLLASLDQYHAFRRAEGALHEVAWRVGELERYLDCIDRLAQALGRGAWEPGGLGQLGRAVEQVATDGSYQDLRRELPGLATAIRSARSVTVGINLDDQLRPMEATLLSVRAVRFRGTGLGLFRRIADVSGAPEDATGIAPLHRLAPISADGAQARGADGPRPLLQPLFRDLADVLERVARPVARALRRYAGVSTRPLAVLGSQLAFYLGAVRLVRNLQERGLSTCTPEILPPHERRTEIRDFYNPCLALHRTPGSEGPPVVTNHLRMGPGCRILILTGPNSGGKTVFTKGIGLAHLLAQAGLRVPASAAALSPVGGIHTHFPVAEHGTGTEGRLGEEARRLQDIFAHALPASLVLMNESLSATSPGEATYLAKDVVLALRLLGARAVFATHLHALAASVADLNRNGGGEPDVASIVSLVDETPEHRPTFRIVPGSPPGQSYAQAVANRNGISFQQLRDALARRGLIR
jgi:hypothetical protein